MMFESDTEEISDLAKADACAKCVGYWQLQILIAA